MEVFTPSNNTVNKIQLVNKRHFEKAPHKTSSYEISKNSISTVSYFIFLLLFFKIFGADFFLMPLVLFVEYQY